MNTSIKNGTPMYDINGKRMHVQFPHIIYHNEEYYLYGSNKEFSNGKGIWHWGIIMYKSKDLYNWEEVGIVIPPEQNDGASPLNPHTTMDAPCILFNNKTKKWVCWIIDMFDCKAYTLQSDNIDGPYIMSGEGFYPCGLRIGDFDIAKDDDDKAYIYFNNPHEKIICAELTDDYLNVTGKYTATLERPQSVPYAREAPSHFERDNKHYLITSGTTGFFPNPSEVAVGTHFGEYETLGNPHISDTTNTSFHSQVRSVFKVPHKKDLYIALADRWLPQYMHVPYEKCAEWYTSIFHNPTPENLEQIPKDEEKYNIIFSSEKQDVSKAECVFLPIIFEDEMPCIYWHDEWSIDEFE